MDMDSDKKDWGFFLEEKLPEAKTTQKVANYILSLFFNYNN